MKKNKRTFSFKKRTVAAAGAALLVTVAALMMFFLRDTSVLPDFTSQDEYSPDIEEIPPWDEMSITRKYPSIQLDGICRPIEDVPLNEELVGDRIKSVTAEGYDIYEKKKYTIGCTLYKIKDVSAECSVALQFDGFDEYYPCINSETYKPKTLGDLIDDLNLRENLTFNSIYTDDSMKFEAPHSSVIWKMLLSDTDAKNRGGKYYKLSLVGISIDVDVIGAENISLAVNKYGYLQTNILGTGKSFYIGKDKVQAFIDYVYENCKKIDD